MTWTFSPDRPIYMQLQERIKLSIVSGQSPPGGKLQAVRDLAEEAQVNPNTVQRALMELEREGLVYTQRTSGRFVTEDKTVIERTKNELAMEIVEAFLHKIAAIGYDTKEATALIAAKTGGSSSALNAANAGESSAMLYAADAEYEAACSSSWDRSNGAQDWKDGDKHVDS